ncbi:MAG: hypothetical protein QNI87_08525 [Erythrobacter sp.]|uniref:hypothetical protein n=1 Tax=Erythrobacter sp. TaxID=1042 RepID=UPI0026134399|nr:hypothetical protein [Erythrobacter sp.]MDJ0978568.1 hypothetical protein [Erythrobacter sp.]
MAYRLLALILLIVAKPALAQSVDCDPILQIPVRTEVTINALEDDVILQDETITIENRGNGTCDLEARFIGNDRSPLPFRIGTSLYNVSLSPDSAAFQFERRADGVYRLRLGASTRTRLILRIDPQVVPSRQAGETSESIIFELVDLGIDEVLEVRNILVVEAIPSLVKASVALSANQSGLDTLLLDFAELETGDRQRFYLQTRANSPITITMTSTNGGQLKNLSGPGEAAIDYALSVDGTAVDLRQPYTMFQPFIEPAGEVYRGEVVIGSTASAAAGQYRDEILVRVETD